jgi:hypothetical protein
VLAVLLLLQIACLLMFFARLARAAAAIAAPTPT